MNTVNTPESWVESANGHADFSLHNLPLGVFSRAQQSPRGGVAVGDCILDLGTALQAGLLQGDAARAAEAAQGDSLNSRRPAPSAAARP